MGIELLLAYITSALASATVEGFRAACLRKGVDIDRAIKTAAGQFLQAEGVEDSLRKWIESESFNALLQSIGAGDWEFDVEAIATSFMADGEFWMPAGEEGVKLAEEVAFAFLSALRDELLQSKLGLSTIASGQQVNQLETRRFFERIERQLETLRAGGDQGVANASGSAVSGDVGAAIGEEHKEATSKIDFAKDLIDMGQFRRARRELEALQESDPLPVDLAFRVITNLGACALGEGDQEGACSYFNEAHLLRPDDPKGIANAATAAHLQDDRERALSLAHQALEMDRESGQAAALIIASLWEAGESEELRLFISAHPWVTSDRQSRLALAEVRVEQSLPEEAAQLCRSCIQDDADDVAAHLMLSQCLLAEAQASFARPGGSDEATHSRLKESEAAATQAIHLLESTERRPALSSALVTRAFARCVQGRSAAALDDLSAANRATPDDASVMLVRGLVLMSDAKYDEARRAFEIVRENDPSRDVSAPLAEACLRSGDVRAAGLLVANKLRPEDIGPEDLWKAELVCQVEVATGEDDSCWSGFDLGLDVEPSNPWLLSVAAIRSRVGGDFNRAEECFQKALGLTSGTERSEILFRLGGLYQQMQRFADAADTYREMVGDSALHPVALELFICLFNAKRTREALEWARRIRAASEEAPKLVIDAEAQILEAAGDLPAAVSLREQICSRDDATALDKVRLAIAHLRCGDREASKSTVIEIVPRELRTDAPVLLELAKLKRMLGMSGWLEDAYSARRFGGDDPDTHVAYFGMYALHESEIRVPEIVEQGCAVCLWNQHTDESRWWLLLEAGEDPQGQHELRSSDELAQRLVGRRTGENIVLRDGLEDLEYEILTVQSKFVRAFQEIAEEFSTRFPDNASFYRVAMEEGDFTKLFQMAERQQQHVRRAEAAYLDGNAPLPFSTFATLLGRSPVEVWSACTAAGAIPIRFASGDEEEMRRATALLSEAGGITLDLIAVMTVHKLGLCEQLRRRFQRVAVPQYVIDEVQEVHTRALTSPPGGYFGKADNGQYVLSESTEAGAAEWQDFTRGLLEFTESLDRISSYGVLDAGDTEPIVDMLTAPGVATIYADVQLSGTPLVMISDDLGLATLASAMGKDVTNSHGLLVELRRSGHISVDDYSVAVERLASMRYSFVRVDVDDLVRRFRSNDFRTSEGTRAMLRGLRGPECTEESAVGVAARVVIELAGEAPQECLIFIFDVLIAEIQRGRDSQRVLGQLRQLLASSSKLQLMPWIREALLDSVALYARLAPPPWHIETS